MLVGFFFLWAGFSKDDMGALSRLAGVSYAGGCYVALSFVGMKD